MKRPFQFSLSQLAAIIAALAVSLAALTGAFGSVARFIALFLLAVLFLALLSLIGDFFIELMIDLVAAGARIVRRFVQRWVFPRSREQGSLEEHRPGDL
jgi:hypothetical protein